MKTIALVLALCASSAAFDAPLYKLPTGLTDADFPRVESALRAAKFKVDGFSIITRNGKTDYYIRWKDGGERKDPTALLESLRSPEAVEEEGLRRKVVSGRSTPAEERRLLVLLLSK